MHSPRQISILYEYSKSSVAAALQRADESVRPTVATLQRTGVLRYPPKSAKYAYEAPALHSLAACENKVRVSMA